MSVKGGQLRAPERKVSYMKIEKNEARKQAVVGFCKSKFEDASENWNQERNADAIALRVLGFAKAAGMNGDMLKVFATELLLDLSTAGLGLYGNASQMRQTLEGKADKPKAADADVSSLLAGYGIE